MKVRLRARVATRKDDFGGLCYVPHRDDVFAANVEVYRAIASLSYDWAAVPNDWQPAYRKLAELGICDTDPPTAEVPYSGPSFLGTFDEIPSITDPLVVNCFSTAFCPLRCIYCHADDLMSAERLTERDDGIEIDNVVATATSVPSLVAVITGGDPLTKPDRAARLITRLAGRKPLVLDTSGVGGLDAVLPTLISHHVHVRVSLDSIGRTNDRLRPVDRRVFKGDHPSRYYAQQTIEACLNAGLAVTVQTVISTYNENLDELLQLRDLICSLGVRHWVLHMTVEGGSARRIEEKVRKRGGRSVVPRSVKVYGDIASLVEDTVQQAKIDVRCTDTNSTPNSVLLIDSRGNLHTEGYAHRGKVQLFSADSARPDLVKAKWMHIDRFGHAKRYLNWNGWLYPGRSLDEICVKVPLPAAAPQPTAILVETEAKYPIASVDGLRNALEADGFVVAKCVQQRDEYYDMRDRSLDLLDYVIRVRTEGPRVVFAFKGPRFYTSTLDYSRLEFQFPMEESSLRSELARQGLVITWVFEKRRTDFRRAGGQARVSIDEVPEIGFFAEIEGPLAEIRALANTYAAFLGPAERRNYQHIFLDFKQQNGISRDRVLGAEFAPVSESQPSVGDEILL